MADITKCSTHNCPLEATCYRKQAVSNPIRQAWGNFPVVGNKCDFYIPTETEKWVTIDVTPL